MTLLYFSGNFGTVPGLAFRFLALFWQFEKFASIFVILPGILHSLPGASSLSLTVFSGTFGLVEPYLLALFEQPAFSWQSCEKCQANQKVLTAIAGKCQQSIPASPTIHFFATRKAVETFLRKRCHFIRRGKRK